ncbi:MAG: stage III sporulation protein AG [Clostridia bacterium]|nr:stage III sporulation protein AG [Clostridia bacterium]
MKETILPQTRAYFRRMFDRYKYVLLIALAGLILILWPNGEGKSTQPEKQPPPLEDTEALETRIEALLERIEGVGKAQVVLTVRSGQAAVYAYDTTESLSRTDAGGSSSRQEQLVTVSMGGGQSPVTLGQTAPVYQGAAVVCQGGDKAAVQLAVTRVIQSLTGLGADHIVITKMND